ncbi:hypothetical protein LSAT2_004241 [Lamellibrachia satsuma]|nr:hypothetical protein LSAT2_004241 [Lamellibrachia satsuma]
MPAQVKLLNVNVMELVKHAILANVFAGQLPEEHNVASVTPSGGRPPDFPLDLLDTSHTLLVRLRRRAEGGEPLYGRPGPPHLWEHQ